MALWEISRDRSSIDEVPVTTLEAESIRERGDLQAVLRDRIAVLDRDLYVLAEEFSDWDDSNRRIDLLCVDKAANLVVVELKRDDSAHADLQAIRYAAMVSAMTFADAVSAHSRYRAGRGWEGDAEQEVRRFLGWDDVGERPFAESVRIILAASTFDQNKELTTAVLWLIDHQIDIRCVTMEPYRVIDGDGAPRIFLDVHQVIPPPQTEEMTIKIAAKEARQREVRAVSGPSPRYDVEAYGEASPRVAQGRTALLIVKAAIEHGDLLPAELMEIRSAMPSLYSMLIKGFPGRLAAGEFVAALHEEGSSFRGFFRDDELIHVDDDSTWSFTNQWTGSAVASFLQELSRRKPAIAGHVKFTPSVD